MGRRAWCNIVGVVYSDFMITYPDNLQNMLSRDDEHMIVF